MTYEELKNQKYFDVNLNYSVSMDVSGDPSVAMVSGINTR